MSEARERLGYSDTIGCASRMHLSPHEWTWTQIEIESMAMTLVEKDTQCVEQCAENEAAQARIAELEGELMLERAVCICGCDNSDHDFLGPDDGECCGNEDHMCLRVAPGIRAMYVDERARADTLQAQVERLTKGLRDIRCVLGDFQEEWSAREASVDKIAKAALTPEEQP